MFRLDPVIADLVHAGFEGEVCIEHDQRTHRLLIRGRNVVAVQVAGHYDPLLERLRTNGCLSEEGYRRTLEAMAKSERRSGELVRKHGVDTQTVQAALNAQLRRALDVLRARVEGTPARVRTRPRRIEAREVAGFVQIAIKTRPRRQQTRRPRHRELARIARALHPDRLMHLPESERRQREARLAHLSARLQGL